MTTMVGVLSWCATAVMKATPKAPDGPQGCPPRRNRLQVQVMKAMGTRRPGSASPLVRAPTTAEAWAPIEIDERWSSSTTASWTGARAPMCRPSTGRSGAEDLDFAPPGGESIQGMGARVRDACESLTATAIDETVVVDADVSAAEGGGGLALGVGDEVSAVLVAPASITRGSRSPAPRS